MDCGRSGLGARKGAWTEEEDALLRKCIEKHGEGKWGRVPMRAGLNRCRKSCRLRWLNYLRPNINRGNFHEDEVDLIFRLHRLLGNRKVFLWSLIAGRLPGRTANDVKNYWNSHLSKRVSSSSSSSKQTNGVLQSQIKTTKVIRPQPRTFSPSSKWLNGNGSSVIQTQLQQAKPLEDQESTVSWWKSLLAEEEETTKEMGTWPLTSWEGGPGDQDMADCFGVLEETDQRKSNEEDDLLMGGAFGDWEENMILDMDLFMLGL